MITPTISTPGSSPRTRSSRNEPPVEFLATIVTACDSRRGRSPGSPSGGSIDVKDEYVAGVAWAPVTDATGAGDAASLEPGIATLEPGMALGCGHWIGCRNVPLRAWPLKVTWSTLLSFAWARNAEYGTSTELLVPVPNSTKAFHTSSR